MEKIFIYNDLDQSSSNNVSDNECDNESDNDESNN